MSNSSTIAIYSGVIPSTTFIERLILGLAKNGHSIVLFGIDLKEQVYPANVKVVVYRNKRINKALHYLKYASLLFLFKAGQKRKLDAWLIKNNKNTKALKLKFYPVLYHNPDIFHIQWAKSLEDWIWVKDFGMKLVLSLRGAHINYSPIADKNLAKSYRKHFPKLDAFHAVSKAIKYEAILYGAPNENIKVVYSGLSEKLLNDEKRLKDNKKFTIVSVGRSHWIKGYSYSLDAMSILKETFPEFKYSIIGVENDIELLYQIQDLELDALVELHWAKPFDITIDIIRNADVLLLSSVKEGIANVVLEAMAVGTIVLSTDCGGMKEVIIDGVNGFMVPVRNSRAIADYLIKIYGLTNAQRNLVIHNAKQTIKVSHNEEQMINSMEALYKNLHSESAL